MSGTGQDVQAIYNQYQAIVRQLQLYEQQEMMLANQLEQYKSNQATLEGLKTETDAEDFIFPLSDILLIKAKFSDVKEVLVDIGSDYYLPTDFDKAAEIIEGKVNQVEELLEKISAESRQLSAMASQIQGQLNRLSQM